MAEPHAAGVPVAVRGDRVVDWATFGRHLDGLRHALDGECGDRWALFSHDAYAFAVGMMAVWQARGVVVVLPNLQPGALADVAGGLRGVITDLDVAAGDLRTVAPLQPGPVVATAPLTLDRAAAGVELFTSGSTGDRKTVVKTLAQLEDEVSGLERSWGALLDGRQALGTVSQQHIYGVLFRVLWPLCAGRPFHAEAVLYPEEMAARLGGRPGYLVSTPAHLRRLADMSGTAALARLCRPFFSSGAPLGEATAARLTEAVGVAPIEVFGSTETGGVAWRQQTGGPESLVWTPFDDVQAGVDACGRLRVASPRVSAPGTLTTGDRVAMRDDGRFVLFGRADRVVKIAGKRLSLPDMEGRLLRHPCVLEAALTVIDRGGEARVAAAVVLSAKGRARLADEGRRPLSAALTAHLAPHWERVLLPRAYRFVAALPEDAQGKVSAAALADLFGSAPGPPGLRAEVLEDKTGGGTCVRRLRAPGAAALEGHFPALAVVPGFVQIDWVMDAVAHVAGHAMTASRIEALKFKELLRPEQIVELRGELSADGACFAFRLVREDGRVVSQGRVWVVEEAP
jgi:acyl-coenzyme A synthetase/AMP-(fatty) acid ligase